MGKDFDALDMERMLWVLADRTRLRLVNLLGDDEVCVCFLVEILEVSQPTISRHLSYLRRAGLVAARREGKWVHYSLVPPAQERPAAVLSAVRRWMEGDPQMQRDRKRLVKVCCSSCLPQHLQAAPRPPKLAAV